MEQRADFYKASPDAIKAMIALDVAVAKLGLEPLLLDLVKLRAALLMSSGASDALKEWDMISFTWALKDMQIVADLTDKAGLSLPVTGAIKELVKDARRIKATNAPKWTGTAK